jgi:hypothetical protein
MHLSFQESPTDLKETFKNKNKEKQISSKAKLLQTCQNKPARRGLVVSHFYCTIGVGLYFVRFFSSLPFVALLLIHEILQEAKFQIRNLNLWLQ